MQSKITHILYADDDIDDREMFVEAVDKISQMSITTVDNGKQFIDSLNNLPAPGLIVLDLRMPFFDGRSCIEAVRSMSRFDKVPILVYTGSYNDGIAMECKVLGADYIQKKPSNFAEILRLVYNITGGRYDSIKHQKNLQASQMVA